jgi:hypothetical protein
LSTVVGPLTKVFLRARVAVGEPSNNRERREVTACPPAHSFFVGATTTELTTMSPASHDDDWPVRGREDSDVAFVGRTVADQPAAESSGLSGSVFYETGTETLFSGEVDRDGELIVPTPDGELDLAPGETLGQVLERVGEEMGWDSFSAFARDHLEDGDEE